jgi:hypothetical protein
MIGSPVAAVTLRVVPLAGADDDVLEEELPLPPPQATKVPSNALRNDMRKTVDVFMGPKIVIKFI